MQIVSDATARRLRALRWVAAVVAALVAVTALVPIALGGSGAPKERLPDLVQVTPYDISARQMVVNGRKVQRLGFAAAAENVGSGPLIVDAHRTAKQRVMTADQLIRRADGSVRRIRDIGHLRFVVFPDHNHWHYMGFSRFELRRTSDDRRVRSDLKQGFCIGDRYESQRQILARRVSPFYIGSCGLARPDLLKVREGITPGYGDDYHAFIEGQTIDITGLPSGRYTLVHRANGDRQLRESSYENNISSVGLDITWPANSNTAKVVVVRQCPGSGVC